MGGLEGRGRRQKAALCVSGTAFQGEKNNNTETKRWHAAHGKVPPTEECYNS